MTSEAPARPPVGPRGWVARVVLAPIRFYQQWISPALPPRCRFYPTCSEYAVTAVSRHGSVKGLGLAVIRLAKCAPWHPGGIDHVPPARGSRAVAEAAADTAQPEVTNTRDTTEPEVGRTAALAATAVGES